LAAFGQRAGIGRLAQQDDGNIWALGAHLTGE